MNCKPVSATAWTAAIALFLTTTTASASAIYSFSGQITGSGASGEAPSDLIREGDFIAGELVYNPEVLANGYGIGVGYANSLNQAIASVSMSNGRASWGAEFGIGKFDKKIVLGGLSYSSGYLRDNGTSVANHPDRQGIFAIGGVIDMAAPAEFPAEGFTLPDQLNIDGFTGGGFELEFDFPDFYHADDGNSLFIDGTIDQISQVSVSVNEPGSLVLLGIGLMAFGRRFWRAW